MNTPTLCLALGPFGVNAMCPTPSYTVISCWLIVNQASSYLRTVLNFMCQAIGNIIRHPSWFLMRCFSLTFSYADISCKLFLVLELISDKKSLILYIQSSYHIPPPPCQKKGKILGCFLFSLSVTFVWSCIFLYCFSKSVECCPLKNPS